MGDGRIHNIDWTPVYSALRSKTNTSFPGYLWHEAVHFDPRSRKWIFLPRKSSQSIPYTPKGDEVQGSNLLLVANEDFSDIDVRTIGDIEPEYGFSSLRKLPGTAQTYVAIKVKELSDPPVTLSKVIVFDLDGKVHSVTPIP